MTIKRAAPRAACPDYAELYAISNFSFLRGASHPEELVRRAFELGYQAIAITDECSLSGVVRAHNEAKVCGIKLIIGSEFALEDGTRFVLLAQCRQSYGRLAHLISHARRQAKKGSYHLTREDVEGLPLQGCIALWITDEQANEAQGQWMKKVFKAQLWLTMIAQQSGRDRRRLRQVQRLSAHYCTPVVACGAVELHHPDRRPLRDMLCAIMHGLPLSKLGYLLPVNAMRYLRPRPYLAELYPHTYLQESVKIAQQCHFSLDELRYEYPDNLVPKGETPATWLRHLTTKGLAKRWPQGATEKVIQQIEKELSLIAELEYEAYFLTVHDIVRFARRRGILCQGRGSAANSAVCYCLGITEVNPAEMNLLFERFISRERDEPPDIDVDFEHERREEVIQYIYTKYGRDRAALAATVITYRTRSAIRDVGKALGFSLPQVDRIAKSIRHWGDEERIYQGLLDAGFSPDNPRIQLLIELVKSLQGFPRHLSQHVGGFVISRGPLSELVPVENASMKDRTVIQWEKDDLESLGLLKIDVLALGMLSAIRKTFDYIEMYRGERLSMSGIAQDDPAVYDMIQKADTVGVFQIESRAQMSMLPRLKPKNYYDLVIEVAIVRPGPIQGDMVHPYLKRRQNPSKVSYPSKALEEVLKRTLGVPIFQEQVMQIAMIAAGFSAGEADQLRRAMAAWKRKGGLEKFETKLLNGMRERGYTEQFAQQIFKQIKGFGDYGFPESHSASFALLAYVSCWLKHYEPAAFCCGLLNSQPMGFYRPAQLVFDAQRHGVCVLPVEINRSQWDCHLLKNKDAPPALCLGLRMIKGLSKVIGERIVAMRKDENGCEQAYTSVNDLTRRAQIGRPVLSLLAAADALAQLLGHRHSAYWQVTGSEPPMPLFSNPRFKEAVPMLARPSVVESTVADYASTGLTLGEHPLSLLRSKLNQSRVYRAEQLDAVKNGQFVRVAGLVLSRQRPGTASGVIFMTLEDESGQINIIVWPKVAKEKWTRFLGQVA